MIKLFILFLTAGIFTLSGCGTTNKSVTQISPTTSKADTQLSEYTSKLVSVQYPQTYQAKETGNMLIVSGAKGKIIIGGFIPAVGHPEVDKKDFTLQIIAYSKDPKLEPGAAVPAALYYRSGDTQTKIELMEILKTVKNLR